MPFIITAIMLLSCNREEKNEVYYGEAGIYYPDAAKMPEKWHKQADSTVNTNRQKMLTISQ